MTIDRVATSMQAQYMLNQINNANAKLNQSQSQVASGKVATDYAGYGDKTAALEAARAAADAGRCLQGRDADRAESGQSAGHPALHAVRSGRPVAPGGDRCRRQQ